MGSFACFFQLPPRIDGPRQAPGPVVGADGGGSIDAIAPTEEILHGHEREGRAGAPDAREQRVAHAVVERHDRVFKFLEGLMAFARDEHGVARLREAEQLANRARAVELDAELVRANRAEAGLNLRGNGGG